MKRKKTLTKGGITNSKADVTAAENTTIGDKKISEGSIPDTAQVERAENELIESELKYRSLLAELEESEKRYRNMFLNNPQPMWIYDLETLAFLEINNAAVDHYGYSRGELLSMTIKDIRPNEDVPGFLEYLKTKRETLNLSGEWRHQKKNKEIIIDKIISHAITYNGRKARHVMALDVTEKRQAEEEIILLNTRLRLIISAIHSIATTYSMESIMHTAHTTARQIMNAEGSSFILREAEYCHYAGESALGPSFKGKKIPLKECICGWAIRNRQQVVIEDIYSDERISAELYSQTFVRSLAVAPIRQDDPLGAIGVYWDRHYIPSPVELQLLQTLADATAKAVENIHLIEGLEERISERTSELQTLNKEMETFSYSVSHDLRAPLRHINGFAEILLRQYTEQLSEDARKYLNIIVEAAHKMGILIDDLLKFSHTGSTELKKSFHDMEQIVRDSLKQITPVIGERKIKWTIHNLPEINGDYNLLRLVWVNLIDNAVKYTRLKKSAAITIGHRVEGSRQVFFIKDNGAGFDMKYADKLFGVFQRMHSSADFEGTGIGLATVRRIVTRHGGETWAESEPDKGATFYFTLPKQPAIL
ncbi:MAG: ATP-binding protein [Bacteroidales bacterium]